MKVCESCIEALEEEGVPKGAETAMAIQLGAAIADHLCDQTESAGAIQCQCACHPRRGASKREPLWRAQIRRSAALSVDWVPRPQPRRQG